MSHSTRIALECPLTLETMREAVIAPCGHSFEREAILTWVRKNGSCPICRSPMTAECKLVPNLAVRQLLDAPKKDEFAVECKLSGSSYAVKEVAKIAEEPLPSQPREETLKELPPPPQSESEYDEVEEVTYVPGTPVESPEVDNSFNPFAEFDEGEDSFAGGLLRPRRPPTPPMKPIVTRRRVKRQKLPKQAAPMQLPDEEEEPPVGSTEPSPPPTPHDGDGSTIDKDPDGVSVLQMEVTIHNLSADSTLPSSEVSIPETPLSWKGVALAPSVPPQRSVKVHVRIKVKSRNGELSRKGSFSGEGGCHSYTVVYRGHVSEHEFSIRAFTHNIQHAKPATPTLQAFNILLFGVAGCGKSSFVNKWATLMSDDSFPTLAFAPAGGGEKHVTKRLVAYAMPDSRVHLWDTWGYYGNYTDDTLPHIFEGRLPSNWKMGKLRDPIEGSDGRKGATAAQRIDAIREGAATAFQRRIHGAILMISIEDLEDPYQCRLIADKFQLFKEFSPILVINKVDRPFSGKFASDEAYFSWLRPWIPPAMTTAVSTAAAMSASAAVTAVSWVGSTASRAHANYQEKGWNGLLETRLFDGKDPEQKTDSRPRLMQEDVASTDFDVISQRDFHPTFPFWANDSSPIVMEIKRVASERCYVSPNSIFLNVNYVHENERSFLMDLQTLKIAEEALRRAKLFEARYGAPDARLPHDASTDARAEGDDWKW